MMIEPKNAEIKLWKLLESIVEGKNHVRTELPPPLFEWLIAQHGKEQNCLRKISPGRGKSFFRTMNESDQTESASSSPIESKSEILGKLTKASNAWKRRN